MRVHSEHVPCDMKISSKVLLDDAWQVRARIKIGTEMMIELISEQGRPLHELPLGDIIAARYLMLFCRLGPSSWPSIAIEPEDLVALGWPMRSAAIFSYAIVSCHSILNRRFS